MIESDLFVSADAVNVRNDFGFDDISEQLHDISGIPGTSAGNVITETLKVAERIERKVASGASGGSDHLLGDVIRLCGLVSQLGRAARGTAGVKDVSLKIVGRGPGARSDRGGVAGIEADNGKVRLKSQKAAESMKDLNQLSMDLHGRLANEQIVRGPGNSWRARQLQKAVNMAVDNFVVTNKEARPYVRHLKLRIYAMVKQEYPPEKAWSKSPGRYQDVPGGQIKAAMAFVKAIPIGELYRQLAGSVEVRVDTADNGSCGANPLQERRIAAGFSVSQLARLARISRQAIVNHESGKESLLAEAQAMVDMILDGIRPKRGPVVYRPGNR